MSTFQEMRELFYPLEWITRVITIALLCLVLVHLTQDRETYDTLVFFYYALIVGAVCLFALQFWNIWVFWKERKGIRTDINKIDTA